MHEQLTYTYTRGDEAERTCILRGVHDAILQAKAKVETEPGVNGTRTHVLLCTGGPDFIVLAVHTYLLGKPTEQQQPSWEAWMFTALNPMTPSQQACSKIMLDAIAGTLHGRIKAQPGYERHEDITVEKNPSRLNG
jgi:hypothetical protein